MPRAKKQNREMDQSPVTYPQPNNNILYVMMGVIVLFLIFLTVKMYALEKKIATGSAAPAGSAAAVQQESPLSVPNLKKYAKELGLNTGKFNKCLDSGEKKALVDKDKAYGSTIGVQGTPGFFINGKFLGGAFPLTAFKEIIDKEINGTGSTLCADYTETNLKGQCDETGTDQTKAFKLVAKDVDIAGMTAEGSKNAKVTIVEFSDFECPYCVRVYPTVKQILSEYKNDVRLFYKQFPLPPSMHPNAEKAAEASLCALDQGKFWEWHNKIFELEVKAQGQ
jgi:protein-disulfide isomerase